MEYLKQLFEIGIQDWIEFVIKSVMLIVISLIILWVSYFSIVKLLGGKTKIHRDFFLPLHFLWALFILFLFVNIYWFYIIKVNGLHIFKWNSIMFYADIGPQLLMYTLSALAFIVSYSKYKSLIKK